MSGHSKYSNIKAKKEKNDAARGKTFTRLGKEIVVAVKEGGPDINNNSKLKQVVAKAKSCNMPGDSFSNHFVPMKKLKRSFLRLTIFHGRTSMMKR